MTFTTTSPYLAARTESRICFSAGSGPNLLVVLLCVVLDVEYDCSGHPPARHISHMPAPFFASMKQQVCVDLMLWCNPRVREFYDAGTIGLVSRVTGGRVTYLRSGDPGGRDTESHLRERLTGALRDHADSASEAILKVGGVGVLLFCLLIGRSPSELPCQCHKYFPSLQMQPSVRLSLEAG